MILYHYYINHLYFLQFYIFFFFRIRKCWSTRCRRCWCCRSRTRAFPFSPSWSITTHTFRTWTTWRRFFDCRTHGVRRTRANTTKMPTAQCWSLNNRWYRCDSYSRWRSLMITSCSSFGCCYYCTARY